MKTLRRRLVTIPGLFVAAVLLTVLIPVWLPLSLATDLALRRFRFPLARLLAFAVCWVWLEVAGVTWAFVLWSAGLGRHAGLHYSLQRWWASNVLAALGFTCGIRIETADVEVFSPGPTVLLVRHASLADSLVSAYVITKLARLHPHYVLKRELEFDPCLDVVGHRIPNYFLDRQARDSGPELRALERLGAGLGIRDVGVIFPEGTRVNDRKRAAALAKIAERDPARSAKLRTLGYLLPPRSAGASAILRAAPTADVVLAWHVGFEGLDTFAGVLAAIRRKCEPVRFVALRVSRALVPDVDAFADWLDDQWLRMDDEVGTALRARNERKN